MNRRVPIRAIMALAVLATSFGSVLPAQVAAFEVASVKLNQSGAGSGGLGMRGRRFVATNMSLSSLVTYGFTVEGKALRQEQLIGLPPWAAVERFDIEAVPGDTSTEVPVEAVREMLKSLLADRFNLRVHHETRPLPVYELVLNGRGPKPADDQSPPDPRDARISVSSGPPSSAPMLRGEARFNIGPGVTTLTARAISTKQLVGLLQGRTDRVLLDKSGFTQFFDLNIEFASGRTPAPDSDATPLFTAIRDAGFKLTSAREPLEVLVIDQVQLPSAN